MKNTKKFVLCILSLCLAFSLAACGEKTSDDSKPSASSPLFAKFTANDLDGNEQNETIFAEHDVTMVNIWGTFCSPCVEEMPYLAELNKEYADKNFQVVGMIIDAADKKGKPSDAEIEAAREIVKKTGADYMHLIPSKDLMDLKLKDVRGVPETLFIDKTGAVIGKPCVGGQTKAEWAKIIDEKLEQVK